MKKLLALSLLAYSFLTKAQAPAPLPAAEQLKYNRQHDSLRTVTAQKRRETDAYNDAYIKQHPNYLRQHPELLKAHPEYRKRYAKYLAPTKP